MCIPQHFISAKPRTIGTYTVECPNSIVITFIRIEVPGTYPSFAQVVHTLFQLHYTIVLRVLLLLNSPEITELVLIKF